MPNVLRNVFYTPYSISCVEVYPSNACNFEKIYQKIKLICERIDEPKKENISKNSRNA